MSDILKERLKEAADKAGTNLTQLAVDLGREKGYFRDYVKGRKRSVSASDVAEAARKLGVSVGWLTGEDVPQQPTKPDAAPIKSATRTIPLYGPDTAQGGGDGRFLFTGEIIAELPCPPQLEGVKNPYAVRVSSHSMAPRYRHGEVVYVNPSKSPRPGDDVVFQAEINGEFVGFIKELVREDEKTIVLLQHNPKKKLTFKKIVKRALHFIELAQR